MKKADKSILVKYKPLWDNGKKLAQADAKVGFCIRNYALNQIFSAFKQNKACLNETEKKEFEQMIVELSTEKKALGPDHLPNQEEYCQFLEGMFNNVDSEDRYGEVTMKTSASFKLISELIEVISQWGEIPDTWVKRSKYCKFKAVDIFKALKAGTAPKRGGPKEEADEASKEINSMIDEQKNNESQENQMDINSKPNSNIPMQDSKNNDINVEDFQNKLNINSVNNDGPVIENTSKRIENYQNQNTFNQPSFQSPPTNHINIGLKQAIVKNNSSESTGSAGGRNNMNMSMIGPDFKVDEKLSKKLDFKLPVKYKGVDYFRLCDIIKKQLEAGQREIGANKVDKALNLMELAYYYIINIEK